MENIVLSAKQLSDIMADVARLALLNFVDEFMANIPKISEVEAFRRYGKAKIKELEKEGLIHWKRNGKTTCSTKEYSITEIEKVLAQQQAITKYYENQGN